MITFYNLGSYGRLGNQLFQYAALKSLALGNNYEVKIPDPSTRSWHGQDCLLGKLNIDCDYITESDLSTIKYLYEEPDYMVFDSNFPNLPDNISIKGFFQNVEYFQGFEEQIKKELYPCQEIDEIGKEKIFQIKKDYPDYEVVSLHLRRGDNTDFTNPNPQMSLIYGNDGALQSHTAYGQYLDKTLNEFKDQKVKFLVFSGGTRAPGNDNSEDMNWCKNNLKGDSFIFSEGNSTLIDYSMIINCDHNIMSPLSSFGWWAAYLNPNPEKKVVAPKNYHLDRDDIDYRKGFYPKEFILK